MSKERKRSGKILLGEDDREIIELVRHLVLEIGLQEQDVVVAQSVRELYEGLDQIQGYPALILLNLKLAGEESTEPMLKTLKDDKRFQGIPVVIFTGRRGLDEDAYREMGVRGFIYKPIENLDTFLKQIEGYTYDKRT